MEQNNFVHERVLVADYKTLHTLIPAGKNNYTVIMTFGYRTDDTALRALLDKELAYLGLLGSKNKINKMLNDLKAAGVALELINRIHAPVGIAIKSQTPEEIAVSIAAEIIKVKNDRL